MAVVEAPNIYDRFFDRRTVEDVSRYMGFGSPSYRLVDLSTEQVPPPIGAGWRRGRWGYVEGGRLPHLLRQDARHPVEMARLCVGNVEWIGARCDDFLFPAPGPA